MSARAEPAAAVRTAVIFTHTHPEQTSAALREAVAAAERASCALSATAEELKKHGDAAGGIQAHEDLPERPDLCLVLGGDGTILSALRHYAGTDVPVFGINFGTIGFLAAVEREQLADGLSRAFGGDYDVMNLPGLKAEIDVARPIALNDVSFIRRPQGRVAELSYRLGGQEVGHVRCDGLVAATPAGSTGYNLANQGPILAWGVEGYVVSFIAPAHAYGPGAGGGAGRCPSSGQRRRPRGRGCGPGRGVRRRAWERGGDRGPLPRPRRAAGAAPRVELLPPHRRQVRPHRPLSG